ncbi:MAG: hypothetical protein BWX93_01945 [Bacteroidetes bacterium ADurb.Bin139]|nr:MAG: hypothetical protein BWX93_01945 [Bacteroidetes bacterium ADurb.Bin139]
MTGCPAFKHQLFRHFWGELGLEQGRKAFQFHTRGKFMLPGGGHFDGTGQACRGNDVPFPAGVVPIRGFKSGFAFKGKLGKITLCHLIFHQIAPFVVEDPFPGKLGFNPVQDGDGANRGPVVIAPQHHGVGCIGAYYGNFLFFA